ncbi:F-box domain-containing protein [Citrus sinensis]|nr:F-box domain-containing protein [Citrus sinensis]
MELREMEERENGVVLLERKTKIKTRKNRKREKRKEKLKEGEEEAEELLQDPLDVFCKDIMLKILKSLNKRSITLSLLVSRTWNGIACSDMLWTSKVAPEYWLNLDPYWKGTSPLMHRYFHEDGSQTARKSWCQGMGRA